jgi:hypothetical protein
MVAFSQMQQLANAMPKDVQPQSSDASAGATSLPIRLPMLSHAATPVRAASSPMSSLASDTVSPASAAPRSSAELTGSSASSSNPIVDRAAVGSYTHAHFLALAKAKDYKTLTFALLESNIAGARSCSDGCWFLASQNCFLKQLFSEAFGSLDSLSPEVRVASYRKRQTT